jgi:hypothetical protein
MKKISPAIKGLITALVMIAVTLWIDRYKNTINPRIQYFVFLIYALGILWTLLAAKRSASFTGKFADLFSAGFRAFIVITLSMVVFTFAYVRSHPELAEQEAVNTRIYYQQQHDHTPDEIEEYTRKAKKQYAVAVISLSIFRYLIIGAILTAAIGFLITRRI